MKAIVLAAGEGSRLRPLTVTKPKPMVRVANKPIVQYSVEALVANGIVDITFVVGYKSSKIQTHFGDGGKFGAKVTYAFQEGLLGTAQAVVTAPDPGEEFLVLGGDNIVDAALIKSLVDAPGTEAKVVAYRSETPSKYGVVSLEGSRIREIVEQPLEPKSDWVNTGVYRLPAAYYARIRECVDNGILGMTGILQTIIAGGGRIEAVKSDGFWADAVYPWDLLRIHAELVRKTNIRQEPPKSVVAAERVVVGRETAFEPGVVLGDGTCIGSNVFVGANCVLNNCVIYDDVQIGPGTILENSIVAEGARLGPRVTAISGECDVRIGDGWHRLDAFGSVIGEDTRVGGGVVLKPGTILGNRTTVGHGRTIEGVVNDQTVLQ